MTVDSVAQQLGSGAGVHAVSTTQVTGSGQHTGSALQTGSGEQVVAAQGSLQFCIRESSQPADAGLTPKTAIRHTTSDQRRAMRNERFIFSSSEKKRNSGAPGSTATCDWAWSEGEMEKPFIHPAGDLSVNV